MAFILDDLDGLNDLEVCMVLGDHCAHIMDYDWEMEGQWVMMQPDPTDAEEMRQERMSQEEEDMHDYQCLIADGLGVDRPDRF